MAIKNQTFDEIREEQQKGASQTASDPGVTIIRGTQVSGPGAKDGSITGRKVDPGQTRRRKRAGNVRSSGSIAGAVGELRQQIEQLQRPQGAPQQGALVQPPPPQRNNPTTNVATRSRAFDEDPTSNIATRGRGRLFR